MQSRWQQGEARCALYVSSWIRKYDSQQRWTVEQTLRKPLELPSRPDTRDCPWGLLETRCLPACRSKSSLSYPSGPGTLPTASMLDLVPWRMWPFTASRKRQREASTGEAPVTGRSRHLNMQPAFFLRSIYRDHTRSVTSTCSGRSVVAQAPCVPICVTSVVTATSWSLLAGENATLKDLPVDVKESVFRQCDLKSQHNLAQTSKLFWGLYKQLPCVLPRPGWRFETRWTASRMWRNDHTRVAAARLAHRFRAQVQLKPLEATLVPNQDSMYHFSLVGHLSQKDLQFILQHPSRKEHDLQWLFSERVVAGFADVFKVDPASDTKVVMLTLKVYHSRQVGCSDQDLDRLSEMFASVPGDLCCWLMDSELDPVTLMCEPVWQLVGPAGSVSLMYWRLQDSEAIRHVVNLHELSSS